MPEADDKPADVQVNVTKTGALSRMQWVSVVGVGTVLLVAIVPWMMTTISSNQKMMNTIVDKNTIALTGVKEQSEDVESAIRSNTRVLNKLYQRIGPDEEAEEPQP